MYLPELGAATNRSGCSQQSRWPGVAKAWQAVKRRRRRQGSTRLVACGRVQKGVGPVYAGHVRLSEFRLLLLLFFPVISVCKSYIPLLAKYLLILLRKWHYKMLYQNSEEASIDSKINRRAKLLHRQLLPLTVQNAEGITRMRSK